ncbi:MAG: UPF0262 family protein [Rhodospirillaceae bacterium]|nr:UPF0262 family protein [Rhodospirillaceae bacterium]
MTAPGDDTAGDTTPESRPRSIVKLVLDEKTFVRRRPEVEHEREVAIFDLLEENTFCLRGEGLHPGPYHVRLKLAEDRLLLDIRDTAETKVKEITFPVKPFRMVVKDYFIVCESYFDAIKTSSPSQIEAIDMGRRALHNEGAQMLLERLTVDADLDHTTARRLFTLLCVLHIRG